MAEEMWEENRAPRVRQAASLVVLEGSENAFGPVLERLRRARKLSRRALAERIGCDASHLTRCAFGTRKPSRRMVEAIADGLSCATDERRDLLRAAGFDAESLRGEASPLHEDVGSDAIRPDHYQMDPEPLAVIEAWGLGFHLGNVVKYVARAGRKPGVSPIDDLKKARFYLDREIERLED